MPPNLCWAQTKGKQEWLVQHCFLMRLAILLDIFVALVAAAQDLSERYLVSLKVSETLENFANYDKNYPKALHIQPLIDRAFTIGKYAGFSGNFDRKALDRLRRCPLVAEITPDIVVNAFDISVQRNSPKHLARLSTSDGLRDSGMPYSYCYEDNLEVLVYVIDSGININHPEFGGRAHAGADFTDEGPGDFNGHGTHVAGLIGSKTYGAAKNATIIEVKALNGMGSGTLSSILSSIDFAVNDRAKRGKPGVANLSLGAMRNNVLNRAVNAAADTGLVIIAAAGNSNMNACLTSPGSAHSAITVGAIDDLNDSLPVFTNWGECVDVFASGVEVESVHYNDEKEAQLLSGTSMAAPIVAGLAANLLSLGNLPGDIKSLITNTAVKNKIPRSSMLYRFRTPNKIAYNGLEGECDGM